MKIRETRLLTCIPYHVKPSLLEVKWNNDIITWKYLQRFKKGNLMILYRKYSLYEEVEEDFWNSCEKIREIPIANANANVCWLQYILENIKILNNETNQQRQEV